MALAPGGAVAAPPAPAPLSALIVEFTVPAITVGAVATRAHRTAVARSPRFDVTLSERAPAIRRALPQLGWLDVAATGSGTTLHALFIALGPLFAPGGPLVLCEGYFGVAPFQEALRTLEDDVGFTFPVSCHVVAFWKALAAWITANALIILDPADFIPFVAIPRAVHRVPFADPLAFTGVSSDDLCAHSGGSLALWSLFVALTGALGDSTARLQQASSLMRVLVSFSSGLLINESSRVSRMCLNGEAQDLIDDELRHSFCDCLATLSQSAYLLRLSGSDADVVKDRRDADSICFEPQFIPAVLRRNFQQVLLQFPALSAIVLPSSAGDAFAAVDSLRASCMPSSSAVQYSVMGALEAGFSAPGGSAASSLLPSLLHASFVSKPVPERVLAALELLRTCNNAPAAPLAGAPSGAAPASQGHSRQLRLYFASPAMMTLDIHLSALKARGDSGIIPFIDAVTRQRSVPLLRILLGATASVPSEADGICSILSMRTFLPRYWFSVLFSSLVDPVSGALSIPAEVAKYKDEWLLGEGAILAPLVLRHAWDKIDWWGLHAFEQMCLLGGEVSPRPVGQQFVDGPAHLAMAPFVDRFASSLGWRSKSFSRKTAGLTPLYATAEALQKSYPREAQELRSALSRAALQLLAEVQAGFNAALLNPLPSSVLPCNLASCFEGPGFDELMLEASGDLKARTGRKSRIFSGLSTREMEARLLSMDAQLSLLTGGPASAPSVSSVPGDLPLA